MTKQCNKKWLGTSLVGLAVAMAVVGVRSIEAIQSAMVSDHVAGGADGVAKTMVTAWPDLVTPLAGCISVAAGLFLIAGILAFKGHLSLSCKAKGQA